MLNYNQVEFIRSFGTVSQLQESDCPEIVFSGRSNVGKSSLINKLFNRKNLAHVSSTPGKTITINFFRCGDVHFADLPGYGFAKRPNGEKRRWAQLMETYFSSGRAIRLVVQLVDMRHPLSADDRDMINFLEQNGFRYLIVLTKSDKLNKTERAARMADFEEVFREAPDVPLIPFSSLSGEGVDALKAEIERALSQKDGDHQ